MKKTYTLLILLILLLVPYSCQNSNGKDGNKNTGAFMKLDNAVYDYGTIEYDSNGRCYFEFTNDSDQELIVNTVRTSCGCTRPEWPKEPVKPGEKGQIGVSYNTRLPGTFHKNITVYSNAVNSPVKLFIKGKVEKRK